MGLDRVGGRGREYEFTQQPIGTISYHSSKQYKSYTRVWYINYFFSTNYDQ